MAKKKFKLSKSLLARFAAISVLVAMGGFAIVQSKLQDPKSDSDEVSDNDDDDGDDDSPEGNDDEPQGDDPNANRQTPNPNDDIPSDTIRVAQRNQRPPTRLPSTSGTSQPSTSSSSNQQSPPVRTVGAQVPIMPGTTPPGGGRSSNPITSTQNRSPGSSAPVGSSTVNLSRPGTTPPNQGSTTSSVPTRPSTQLSDTRQGGLPSVSSGTQSTPPGTTPPTGSGSTARVDPNDPSSSTANLLSPNGGSSGSSASTNGIGRPTAGQNGLRTPGGSGSGSTGTGQISDTGSSRSPSSVGTTNGSTRPSSTSLTDRSMPSSTGSGSRITLGDQSGTSSTTGSSGSATSSDPTTPSIRLPNQSLTQTDSTRNGGSSGTSPRMPGSSGSSGAPQLSNSSQGSSIRMPGTLPNGGSSGSQISGSTPNSTTGVGTQSIGSGNTSPTQGSGASVGTNPYVQNSSTAQGEPRGYGAPNSSRSPTNPSSTASSGTSPRTTYPSSYGSTQNRMSTSNSGSALSSNTPGSRELDGAQTPSLAILKRAPSEIQVGRMASFETLVRNTGQTDAANVIVTDRVPAGTRLESVEPQPITNANGLLVWDLGTISPGREQTITMNVVPEQKGEIGSVAQVTFNAQASVRTICTKPELAIEVVGPERVLIGQDALIQIVVRNNGDGAATNVMIEEDVPSGVSHPEGREIQYPLGTLGPGESRQLALALRAESAAVVRNAVVVRGDNQLFDQAVAQFEVVAPTIQVTMTGPRKRYLERTAIHEIRIENQGTASATNVEIVARLPSGLKFEETNNHGTYDPTTHAVYWGLEELPAGVADDSIRLVTLPVATGEQNIDYQATADLNLADSRRQPVVVEELAELFFDIDDVADPIEINSETLYHLRVTNQGSKAATQIQLRVNFPPALEPIAADGGTEYDIRNQTITFEPIERLGPGQEILLRIQARGKMDGEHLIDVVMESAESRTPVTKQASTSVYRDR